MEKEVAQMGKAKKKRQLELNMIKPTKKTVTSPVMRLSEIPHYKNMTDKWNQVNLAKYKIEDTAEERD